jgi:glycosyltransferase involved in cell wall biosynthesis
MPIKILQINTVATYSSTGRIVEGIGQSILARDWESYVGYGRKDGSGSSKTYKIGQFFSKYLHVIETRLLDRHGLGSRKATLKFIKWVDELKPDVVQLHNLHGYYVNLEILFEYLKKSGVPVVVSLHDSWLMTGHCTQFEDVKCEKWKTQCFKCPLTQLYPQSLFVDRSFENYKLKKRLLTQFENLQLVTSSKWSAAHIKESFLADYKIEVIPNGVDINVFKPKPESRLRLLRSKYQLDDKFIILGVAAIWTENKGFNDFLKAASKLLDDEIMVMIGLDETQCGNLPENIIGIKRTESVEELADWYSAADVFFNPTYADTFPTTNLESLACGTPVVTYATGGSVESVDNNTGYVVGQGDIQVAFSDFRQIKSEGKIKYSSFCRQKAVTDYDKDKQFGKYVNLYSNCISSSLNL